MFPRRGGNTATSGAPGMGLGSFTSPSIEMDTTAWAKRIKSGGVIQGRLVDPPLLVKKDSLSQPLDIYVEMTGNDRPSISFNLEALNKAAYSFSEAEEISERIENSIRAEFDRSGISNIRFMKAGYFMNVDFCSTDFSQSEIEAQLKELVLASEILLRTILRETKYRTDVQSLRVPSPPKGMTLVTGRGFPTGEETMDVSSFEITDMGYTLDDLGGNASLKTDLRKLISFFKNPEHFKSYGADIPSGVLLYGPPGTGKTLTGKIIASELGIKFYYVKLSDIVSKWYGESEQRMKQLFDNAEGPCVVFIDEIDAIASNRDTSHEASARILSELLQQLDGMSSRQDILFVAATNRINQLDGALLRPGRFDKLIEVPVPDEEARKEIWEIHLRELKEKAAPGRIAQSIDTGKLAQLTDGMTGADIKEILRRSSEHAAFKALEEGRAVQINKAFLGEQTAEFRKERERSLDIPSIPSGMRL